MKGPIDLPVVLILHGINNNASFGYVKSLMRTCTNRGWLAVGMNFRGCGGVPLATPRAYNGA
jgi:predicted alpha/beta-fold hydrolase